MKTFRWATCFLTSVVLAFPGAPSGWPGHPVDSKYDDVLDLVFPTEWEQCFPADGLTAFDVHQVTIRILPGLSYESQIFICKSEKGSFFVVSSTLDPKDKSVWGHTQKLRRIDDRTSIQEEVTESAEEIAAAIHPIHKSCSIDSRLVEGWFRRLANVRMSLPLAGGGTDGVFYEVTLKHGMDIMQAKIWVWKQQKPLTTLVEDISREIERASCKEIQRLSKKM